MKSVINWTGSLLIFLPFRKVSCTVVDFFLINLQTLRQSCLHQDTNKTLSHPHLWRWLQKVLIISDEKECLYFCLPWNNFKIFFESLWHKISPVMVVSTQEKVIPPTTLSLKRNKNVPLCFLFRRDFSLPLLTKPMMWLKHRWKVSYVKQEKSSLL